MLVDKSLREFLGELASASPTPGGGSASALAAAVAASLFSMVGNLTVGKEAEKAEALRPALLQVMALAEAFTRLVDRDAQAYDRVRDAYRLPKEREDDKIKRAMEIQLALREATTVPLELAEKCVELMEAASDVVRLGRPTAISDAGVANFFALTAVMGGVLNVEVNLQSVDDEDFVRNTIERVGSIQQKSRELFDRTQQIVLDRMNVCN